MQWYEETKFDRKRPSQYLLDKVHQELGHAALFIDLETSSTLSIADVGIDMLRPKS